MSIQWLTIFLVLMDLVLIDSSQLSASNVENKQWTNDDSANDVSRSNGQFETFKVGDAEVPIGIQKAPVRSNGQKTIGQRRNAETEVSSEKKDDHERMIAALSKIAKIQLAEEDSNLSTRRDLMAKIYDAARVRNIASVKSTDESTLVDIPFGGYLDGGSNGRIEQQNFHCQAIRDVYISDIEEYVPAYACKYGSRTFVLSSKRFLQDRRSSLDVNVDEDTLRKLSSSSTVPINGRFNVIPATLVLKPGHENYEIRD